MHYVARYWWPAALVGYGVVGALLGAMHGGWPRHTAIGASVVANLYVLLPLECVLIAILYPSSWTAIPGTILASIAWFYAAATYGPHGPWDLMYRVPILAFSWLLQATLCLLTMMLLEKHRTVGKRPARQRCLGCGYPLIGLPGPRCPECGRPFTPLEHTETPTLDE